jgi:putative ABC transport system permease protein
MNFVENIKEGLRSIKANMLRSVLTSLIVAIGIVSLVGALTAVDNIEFSLKESLSSLGANTFEIYSKRNRSGSNQGVSEKRYPQLRMSEVVKFADEFRMESTICVSADLTGIAEIKYLSKKTNPNVRVLGINQEYFAIKSLDFEKGRSLSSREIEFGVQTAVLGFKVAETLFKDENVEPVGAEVSFMGTKFRVAGVLKEKGQMSDDNYDNMVFIPLIKANQMAKGRGLWYEISVGVNDPTKMDLAMGEATGLMRAIRRDEVGKGNSFELARNESLQEFQGVMDGIRLGGFGIGFITLLGASIALMNIMLVSVTERTREVGVRKALGATPLRIRQQFIIEAVVVCMLGGIAGIIFGILIGNLSMMLFGFKSFIIPWFWMFVGFVVCVFVGILSGYYPANKASKLDPIESLRFE